MMVRVSGSVEHVEPAPSDRDGVAVGECGQIAGRNGHDLPPQRAHHISIYAGGAGDELRRIDEVRSSDLVDVYLRLGEETDKGTGGAGVIEMNVGEKQFGD